MHPLWFVCMLSIPSAVAGKHVKEPNRKHYYITHYYNLSEYVSLSFDLYYFIDCWGYLSILSSICKGLQVGILNLIMVQLRFINDSSPLLICQLTILQCGQLCRLVQVNQMKDITDNLFLLVHSKWVYESTRCTFSSLLAMFENSCDANHHLTSYLSCQVWPQQT